MKLRRLAIERLPGIDRAFDLDELANGLNIIVGPNGVGKSRMCAAVQALLWREHAIEDGRLAASAVFELDNARWRVARDGSRHGWQRGGVDSDPPPLPGEHLHACFFLGLRDLLDDSDSAGKTLADEIRRQMSGGFDLDKVWRSFAESVSKQVGKNESKAVSAAENEIRKAEQKQADVARQEREIDALETQANDADLAQKRLVHFDTALSLRREYDEHKACEDDLAALPDALARLEGNELERLEKLDERLDEKRGERETANDALTASRTAAHDSRLDEPIEGALLAAWRGRAESLAEVERNLHVAVHEARATHEALVSRQKALGGLPNANADLSIKDDADLFSFLRESQKLATERETLEIRLAQLASHEFSAEEARRRDLLKRACESLRTWLRAPDPGRQATGGTLWPTRVQFLVAAVVLGGIGTALYFAASRTSLGLVAAGVGLGLAVVALLARVRAADSGATDWRSVAEQQFPQGTDAGSVKWTVDAVGESLRRLEQELAVLEAKQEHDKFRKVEGEQFEVDLERLETVADGLEPRRKTLAKRLGLDAVSPDAEMVDLARALDALRNAQAEHRSAVGKRDTLEEHKAQLLADVAACFTALGEIEPTDGASAKAGVHTLEERDRTLRAAQANTKQEEQTRGRLDREIEQLSEERAQIFRVATVEEDDRVALMRVVDQLARYGTLTREREEHASHIRRQEAALEAAEEGALARLDASRLADEKESLSTESKQGGDLRIKIGEIRSLARTAREGHVLEDAIARRSVAIGVLRDRYDKALVAEAGSFLVEKIRHEHEVNQMPRVLERARHHFGAFTHHRYVLNVSPSGGASFVAVDAKSGAELSLDKLSDGTRAQLILAARLAFAEDVEQGEDLPLFLDEALEHSDPDRFHAIARSLARMVAEDARQVFYLSNDPTDVARFKAAFDEEGCDQIKEFDLAAILCQAARVDGPKALCVAPLGPVPDPAGESAEGYGVAIGVASLDPTDTFGNSLYYLLRDDLYVLYEFLQERIDTVGQCRNVLKGNTTLGTKVVPGSEIRAQLESRIELFETFCLAWREGRGEKVGRAAIEASNAVSGKFFEAVVEFAEESGGDARRVINALCGRSDERFKGYHRTSADDLKRYFIDNGHIDERPDLGESEIVERALGTPAGGRLPASTTSRLLHEWWSMSPQAATRQ